MASNVSAWCEAVFDALLCWFFKDAEVDLQETAEYQAAKETLEETRALARR